MLCNDVVLKKGGFPGVAKNDQDGDGDIETRAERADGKFDDPYLASFVQQNKFFICKNNSEDIANISHLALTVTLLDLKKPEKKKEIEDENEEENRVEAPPQPQKGEKGRK